VVDCELRIGLDPQQYTVDRRSFGNLRLIFDCSIALGEVPPDYAAAIKVHLKNDSAQDITIDDFISSCQCAQVIGLPITVSASGSADLEISTNMSRTGDFFGQLSVVVDLLSCGSVVGSLEIKVIVAHA
jgi:hypothetical protein